MFLSFLIFVGTSSFLINGMHGDYVGCTEPATDCRTPWDVSWVIPCLGYKEMALGSSLSGKAG